MPYFRVTYEWYIEGEYADEEAAKKEMLEALHGADETNLSVATFNEEKREWE